MAESNRRAVTPTPSDAKATPARAAVCSRPSVGSPETASFKQSRSAAPSPSPIVDAGIQEAAAAAAASRDTMETPYCPQSSTAKRLSSTRVAPGARAYGSWLRNKSAVRNVLAKRLSAEHSNNLVLTGTSRMEGQITSLTMVSQSLANHKQAVAAMRKQKCFSAISNVHLSMLASVAKTRFHSRYSIVYREGAEARSFYILVRGTVQQKSHDGPCEQLTAKQGGAQVCFGTEAIAGGMHRLSSVMCVEDCELLHFSTTDSGRLDRTGIEALAKSAFAAFIEQELTTMPLFFKLSRSTLHEVACMFELREPGEAGIVIFSPGMPADEFYILVKGRIALQDGDGVQFAKLVAGSAEDGYPFFGQDALLRTPGAARLEFAVTTTPCKLLVLPRRHFSRITKLVPELHARLVEFQELRQSRADLSRQMREAKRSKQKSDREAQLRKSGVIEDADDEATAKAKAFAAECITKHTKVIIASKQAY